MFLGYQITLINISQIGQITLGFGFTNRFQSFYQTAQLRRCLMGGAITKINLVNGIEPLHLNIIGRIPATAAKHLIVDLRHHQNRGPQIKAEAIAADNTHAATNLRVFLIELNLEALIQ